MLNILTQAVAKIRTGLMDAVTPQCHASSHGDNINDEVTIGFRLADIDRPDGRRAVVSLYAQRITKADRHAYVRLRDSLQPPYVPPRPLEFARRSPPVAAVPAIQARKAEAPAAPLWSPPAPPPPRPTPTPEPGPRPSAGPQPAAPSRPQPIAAQAPDRAAPGLRPAEGTTKPVVSEALTPLPPAVRTTPSARPPAADVPRAAPPPQVRDMDAMLDNILDIAAGRRRVPPSEPRPARPAGPAPSAAGAARPAGSAPRKIPAKVSGYGGSVYGPSHPRISRSVYEMGITSNDPSGCDWRSCAPGLDRPNPETGLAHTISNLGIGSGW